MTAVTINLRDGTQIRRTCELAKARGSFFVMISKGEEERERIVEYFPFDTIASVYSKSQMGGGKGDRTDDV